MSTRSGQIYSNMQTCTDALDSLVLNGWCTDENKPVFPNNTLSRPQTCSLLDVLIELPCELFGSAQTSQVHIQ